MRAFSGELEYLEKFPTAKRCAIITTMYGGVIEFIANKADDGYINFQDIFLCDFYLKCDNGDRVFSDWGEPTDTQGHSHDLRVVIHKHEEKSDEIPY